VSERQPRRLRIGARLILCFGLAASAPGCSSSPTPCKEYRTESKESPERRYTATTFLRVCGVRPNVTHVNLHDGTGETPPDASGEVFSVVGALKADIVWQDAKTLLIECVKCDEKLVLKREAAWKDVRVTFAAK
jgi:hypothetical protein